MVRLIRALIPGLILLILVLLLAGARAVDRPVADIGREDTVQLFLRLRSEFDIVEGGRSIPVIVEVYDDYLVPAPGILVHIEATAGSVSPSEVVTDEKGEAALAFLAEAEETTDVTIYARTGLEEAIQGYDELRVKIVQLPPPPIYARTEVISLGIASLILGIIAKTEVGKYALLNFFTFPLYIRLKREEVLDHFVRGQIYGFIRTNPGAHYSMIRDALVVTNGTLSHHLKTLEVQGFVTSQRDGVYKRFFPLDFAVKPKGKGIRLSDLQARLLTRLKQDGEALQAELAKELNVTQQCISYNLRLMYKGGFLDRERVGRRLRHWVLDG